jgi:putative restriction endonuclease
MVTFFREIALRYAFQGNDPGNHDNAALRESFADQSPLIYFYALAPRVYQILYPSYIIDWDPRALRCAVAVGSTQELSLLSEVREPADQIERQYSTIEAKMRLHQAELRELVLGAYGRRCAISGLPILNLLEERT